MTTILVIEVRMAGHITGAEQTRLCHHIGDWNHLIETARIIGKTTQPDPDRDTLDGQTTREGR